MGVGYSPLLYILLTLAITHTYNLPIVSYAYLQSQSPMPIDTPIYQVAMLSHATPAAILKAL